MIVEPKILAARGSLMDPNEVSILFDLLKNSSRNVRMNILDTLTHLPLPEQEWVQVAKLVRQEFQDVESFQEKAALLEIGTWIPYGFDLEDEVRRIETDSEMQKNLLDAVKGIQHQYPPREDYDHEWAASQAPGFFLFSESELSTLKSHLRTEVPTVVSKLSDWWPYDSSPPDIAIEHPVLITLLFELPAYEVGLTNSLVWYLEGLENFRPDLYGLFEEYLRCVNSWITDRGAYFGESNARWFQLNRDDEDSYSWRSWQIAWTVSRGGLKGLIPALIPHLTAKDETRQIAALALIADSADYTLQRSAAIFGGGIRPPRLDPNEAPRLWLPEETEIKRGIDKEEQDRVGTQEVQFTAYHPIEVKPDHWYTLLAYVHVMNAQNAVHEDSQFRLGTSSREYRKEHGNATSAIVRGTEIVVVPELPGCRFNPPRSSVLWLEDWHGIEFRMQASEGLPGFELNTAVNGRLSFYVGPILVGEIKLWAHVSDDDAVGEDSVTIAGTANPYQAVFVSYSHKDTHIVQALEKAYVALGISYLRDVNILRSGEKWNQALLRKIEEADIFQLCWSKNAKRSRYVEQEWRHALKLQRPSFIRPVYWEDPMPDPPEELADIHFAPLPK